MTDRTQDESADVLMHNGRQYVRVDYLTRLQAERDSLLQALEETNCECYLYQGRGRNQCPRCAALEKP